MQHYQLRFIGDDGRVQHIIELECAHDDEAMDTAARHQTTHTMEVWCGDRHVICFPARPT